MICVTLFCKLLKSENTRNKNVRQNLISWATAYWKLGVDWSIKYKIIWSFTIYIEISISFLLYNHLLWYLKSIYSKNSIKPWYDLVRASLNFVRALLNLIKLVSILTCSSARVRPPIMSAYASITVTGHLWDLALHSGHTMSLLHSCKTLIMSVPAQTLQPERWLNIFIIQKLCLVP